MKAFSLRVIALASLPAFGACADVASPTQEPQGLKIAVAPLQLTGIGDACYNILIENAQGVTFTDGVPAPGSFGVVGNGNDVVSLNAPNGAICASQYGNTTGGDITYIAPCDATSDTNPLTGSAETPDVENHVTIWPFLKQSVGGAPLTDWEDPCGTDGCRLQVDCRENADTLVEFNLTIMREANQGFFDVAVNFSDIFCSAKVDCQYADNSYIRLVHGTDGVRTASAVVAFACTDGNDTGSPGETHLYASAISVNCDETANDLLIPVNAAGNVDFNGATAGLGNPDGVVEAATVFMGSELLQNNGSEAGKVYWNAAVGFEEVGTTAPPTLLGAPTNCTISFVATASEGPLSLPTQGYNSYPFLEAIVDLTDTNGAFTCGKHPLNGADFVTTYRATIPTELDWTINSSTANAGTAASF